MRNEPRLGSQEGTRRAIILAEDLLGHAENRKPSDEFGQSSSLRTSTRAGAVCTEKVAGGTQLLRTQRWKEGSICSPKPYAAVPGFNTIAILSGLSGSGERKAPSLAWSTRFVCCATFPTPSPNSLVQLGAEPRSGPA